MKKIGYFEEEEGVKSLMRLNSFIALCAAIVIAVAAIAMGQINPSMVGIISAFLGGAFGPKAIQKFAETKKITK